MAGGKSQKTAKVQKAHSKRINCSVPRNVLSRLEDTQKVATQMCH